MQVISRSSACCRRQRQDPTRGGWLTCFMWKSGAGRIEIVRLLPEAEARPDTRRLAHMFRVKIRCKSYRDRPLLEGRWVVNYMYNLLSKYGCCNTYLSRHIFRLSCFSNTELKHIVCELSRCTLSCISVLTCILGRGILLKKGSARPGSRVYSRKISSKKFVQQDIMCL